MQKEVIALLAILFCAVLVRAEVVTLDDSNFEKYLSKNKIVLLKLYSPGCPHCIKFEPIYIETEKFIRAQKKNYVIAQIDCNKNKKAGEYFRVTSYPMVKLVKGTEIIEFKEERTMPNLLLFLQKHLGSGIELLKTIEEVEALKKTKMLRVNHIL